MDGVALGLVRLQEIYRQLQIITVDVSGETKLGTVRLGTFGK